MHSGENLPVIICRFILSLTITKQRPFCQQGILLMMRLTFLQWLRYQVCKGKDAEKELAF